MNKNWKLLETPPVSFFNNHPELPKIAATLLYHRNIRTQEEIDEFLNPDYLSDIHDPFLFQDMDKAVNKVLDTIKKNKRIVIHGDYDADGVSAAVILTDLFKALDYHNFDVFLPHRETDGYGLNKNTIQLLAKEKTDLIITCDCGSSNNEEVELAKKLDMEVIITDHHTMANELKSAYAVIHPKAAKENYPDKGLSGGAVAFKFMQGILKKHSENHKELPNGEKHESIEKWALDMVAIASVADMVPLVGESRTLTKYGLIVLNKTKRIGLQKLLLESRLMDEEGILKREINSDTIAFQIAPRINAAGRMNHANVGYKLLSTQSPTEAIDLAYELDQNNQERQKKTDKYVKEAIEQIKKENLDQSPVIFVFKESWSTGIIGLISSKIKDKYSKPALAITANNGDIVGSGRGINGFDLIKALNKLSHLFTKFGGHPTACGFTLESKSLIDELKTSLIDEYNQQMKGIVIVPELEIDAEVDIDHIDWELFDILDKFKPFGQGNPRPKYLAKNCIIKGLQSVGKDKKHLRIMVSHKSNKIRKTIGWRLCSENGETNWCNELSVGDVIDIVFEVDINEWNGTRELQLTIVDLKKIK